MSKTIDDTSALLNTFPYALSRDVDKAAIAESIVTPLSRTLTDTEYAEIFTRIDKLPEELLDKLSYDLKIEWYASLADIQYKRKAIKECILVHRYKGTKYAVETALHSVYDAAVVKEWFEYGGEPFRFQLTVFGGAGSGYKDLKKKVEYAKNLRSVMDDTKFTITPEVSPKMHIGAKPFEYFKSTTVAVEL